MNIIPRDAAFGMSAITAGVFVILMCHMILLPFIWVLGCFYGLRWLNRWLIKNRPDEPFWRQVMLVGVFCAWTGLLVFLF